MRSAKRVFEIVGSILSILISCLLLFICLTYFLVPPEDDGAQLPLVKVIFIFFIIFALSDIVLSILVCIPPKINPKTHRYKERAGLVISLLIVSSILGGLFDSMISYDKIILLVTGGASLLLFVSLFMKPKEVMEESVVISQSNIDEIASSMFKSRPKESQETSQENDQKGE